MRKICKAITFLLMAIGMLTLVRVNAYAAQKVDEKTAKECIEEFCEKMYGSMLADSTTSFSKSEFLSIDGYLTAKVFEAKRDYALIDVPGGVTSVSIEKVVIDSITESDANTTVQALVCSEYTTKQGKSEWGNRYVFTLGIDLDEYAVLDVKALEGDEFLNVKNALPLWKTECGYAGEDWEYEAVDRILNSKKVDLRDLIEITEIEPEPEPPASNGTKSTTVSYSKAKATSYAYTTAGTNYNPENYIFCAVSGADCTNFVSQCVWAGYEGAAGYALPTTPTYTNSAIRALRTRVQNDYRMVPGSWYGRYYRTPAVVPPANWCGVTDFWDYAVGNTGNGPVATGFNNGKKWNQYSGTIQRGDVLQFHGPSSSSSYSHSVIVYSNGTYEIDDITSIYVCQHSGFNNHRQLSEVIRSWSNNDPSGTPCYMRRMRFYDATFSS